MVYSHPLGLTYQTSEALRLYPILHRLMLVGDITVSDPREALHDVSNSSKVGNSLVLFFREAFELIGNPYSTETTLKFFIRWKAFIIIMAILQRDPETRSRTSLHFGSFENTEDGNLKAVCVNGSTNQRPRNRPVVM